MNILETVLLMLGSAVGGGALIEAWAQLRLMAERSATLRAEGANQRLEIQVQRLEEKLEEVREKASMSLLPTAPPPSYSLSPVEAPKNGYHVLIVDDDPAFLSGMMRGLEQYQGFDVDLTPNALGALVLARSRRYDAAIVDVYLTGVSGVELVPQMRAEHSKRFQEEHLPIVLVSGAGIDELADHAAACGADAFLAKPMTDKDLADALIEVLGIRTPRA